jgi:formate dehydrogenase subunit delta
MEIAVLVRMANDVAHFFEATPDQEQAAKEIATHLRNFWDPSMRRELVAHAQHGGEGLRDSVKRAVGRLEV